MILLDATVNSGKSLLGATWKLLCALYEYNPIATVLMCVFILFITVVFILAAVGIQKAAKDGELDSWYGTPWG